MAVTNEQITDQAAAPSQSPKEIVDDAGIQPGVDTANSQTGTDVNDGGTVTAPDFGFAGSFATVDDATFVPSSGNVGASRFQPGQKFSEGYLNEFSQDRGEVSEGNLIEQNRPVGATPDIQTVMGIA